MKIYLFDMNTKRYQKEGEAIYNPENPSNPHIPAYATKLHRLIVVLVKHPIL